MRVYYRYCSAKTDDDVPFIMHTRYYNVITYNTGRDENNVI